MKRFIVIILLGAFIMAGGYPEYRMGYINDRSTIAHLDGIWHDVKVYFDESGNVVYRAVHELIGQPVDSVFWCVWKYTYDMYNHPTRIEGPLCGKFGIDDKTSNTYWFIEEGGLPWLTSSNIGYLIIYVSSDWSETYKPNKLRVSFTGADTIDISIRKIGDIIVDEIKGYISGEEINLNFDYDSGEYIFKIWCENFIDTSYNINKIDFLFLPDGF